MGEVTGTPASATEGLAADDQAAAEAAQTAEVSRDHLRPQTKLCPDGMQSRQLAVVGDADVSALNAQIAESAADFGAERILLPIRALRPAHGRPVPGDVTRYADFDSNQVLVSWQLSNLGPQLAVQGVEGGVRLGSTQVGRHGVSPQLAPGQGCGGELESIEVDAYPEDAPRLTVEINRASRSTGSGPANRIELLHDPASPQFPDQVGHRGDAEPAAARNVVTAASSMVAHVAKDLGEISLA